MRRARQRKLQLFITLIMTGLCAAPIAAQTTAFTYQGKLTEAGNPANGSYDLQFKLFDTVTVGTGTQQGATLTNPTVQVTAGIFVVNLDFGTNVFTGAARFLEISVRPAGTANPYTVLAPRQQITSSPYAIQTVNAQQLGSLPATRYVATDTNGNIGIGTATPSTKLEVVNPANQLRFGSSTADNGGYLISNNPSEATIMGGAKWDGTNLIARDTAASFTQHQFGAIRFFTNDNLSVGNPYSPTQRMLIESNGNVNIGGGCCGLARLTVGAPGFGIMHADGEAAIISYLQPSGAALFGTLNTHPLSLVIGFTPRMTLDTSGNVGIGTSAPLTALDVRGNLTLDPGGSPTLFTSGAGTEQNRYLHLINSPSAPSASGLKAGGILVADEYGYGSPTKNDLIVKGFVGIGLGANVAPANPLHVAGDIRIGTGFTGCVLDADGTVIAGTCSSDARLKRDILPFAHLLDKVAQLQPVQFYWRAEKFKERHFGTRPSFGLIAQEVEKVLPELVREDEQGYKAVNYSKLPLLALQAIKELKAENDAIKERLGEQQARTKLQQQQDRQLKEQQMQIERQQKEIDELRQAVKTRNRIHRKHRKQIH